MGDPRVNGGCGAAPLEALSQQVLLRVSQYSQYSPAPSGFLPGAAARQSRRAAESQPLPPSR
eukprot:2326795-Prymnesium_polylepis.1